MIKNDGSFCSINTLALFLDRNKKNIEPELRNNNQNSWLFVNYIFLCKFK